MRPSQGILDANHKRKRNQIEMFTPLNNTIRMRTAGMSVKAELPHAHETQVQLKQALSINYCAVIHNCINKYDLIIMCRITSS